ncbi:hypothetical protein Maes01_00607 [Microbulbifer aestuariivivens]|uniref:Uncharacterized protein n=1 Tax=Microbulbifer aestuariivivens TaxID=1908308 RepID=A0ABP9WLS7_9GAMM
MEKILRTLEHLSYIIECASVDFMGEAKTELQRLCEDLENDSEYFFAEKEAVSAELRDALSKYKNHNYKAGTSKLASTNRKLWRLVIP